MKVLFLFGQLRLFESNEKDYRLSDVHQASTLLGATIICVSKTLFGTMKNQKYY